RIGNDMNAIYSNVNEMLRQKASIIESAVAEIGKVDTDEFTVPITFILTPKEVSENTAVSLDFDGELFPMDKNDTTFVTTVSRNIFGDAMPKIVINENGVKKTTHDDQINIPSIKERVFPIMFPRLMGEAKFDGKTYRRKGNLSADIKEISSEIEFREIRLVIEVDNKVISDETIPKETFFHDGYEIDEKIPLNDGQTCIMKVVATDSIGFEHHYVGDRWDAGSNHQREPWFGDEQIYSPDGGLLWESDRLIPLESGNN
ncbi:MAG TPA: hypothetical protein VFD17_00315, partial [Clostridia bacterium]|nr:hypothetical protein [Clostridia bacterium]